MQIRERCTDPDQEKRNTSLLEKHSLSLNLNVGTNFSVDGFVEEHAKVLSVKACRLAPWLALGSFLSQHSPTS